MFLCDKHIFLGKVILESREPMELETYIKAIQSKELKFPCTLCEHTSSRRNGLKRHILAKHTNVRVRCEKCDRTFIEPAGLRRHQIKEHPELETKFGPQEEKEKGTCKIRSFFIK